MIEINASDQEKQLSLNPLHEVKINTNNEGNQTTEKDIETGFIEKKSIPKEKSEKKRNLELTSSIRLIF